METFSINEGESTQTTGYRLTGDLSSDEFIDILDNLRDGVGIVDSEAIRNAIFSINSSTIFKETNGYIGIDTLNPDDEDIKGIPFLFGKRSISSTSDTMDWDFSEENSDVYLYNTKSDSDIQDFRTRISILSGNSRVNKILSPFIQTQDIKGVTFKSFDFINTSGGNINIGSTFSETTQGEIILNGISIGSQSPMDGDLAFTDDNNKIEWKRPIYQINSPVFSETIPIEIWGKPIELNGYSLEFTDERRSPVEIGDIRFGEQFSDFSIFEMLQRLVYAYLPPTASLKILPPFEKGYAEVGTKPPVVLEYTLNKKTLNTLGTSLLNMEKNVHPPIVSNNYKTITDTSKGIIPQGTLNQAGITYSVTITDGENSFTDSKTLKGVYPYFYGILPIDTIDNSSVNFLEKIIEPQLNQSIIINGVGNLFFIYDSDYGDISTIKDNDGLEINPIPTPDTIILSTNFWVNKEFKVYKIEGVSHLNDVTYEFHF
jgi:hypothetical protein